MRKKYLSALLFGALLVTSTGTFTSCKDYDDDINNLQEQITANADAIKKLQELVNAGKYVSGVAMEGQVITFTFSDGTTQTVTIPEGESGQVVEVKNNELYIDGKATGIKVAEEAAVEVGLVKAENGTWWVLGEDGEYTNTNIPVSGVTVSGSEKDGYTFTIYNEKGEAQTVKLPTAASSITEMTLGEKVIQPSGFTQPGGGNNDKDFYISAQTFTYTNLTGETKLDNSDSWMGNKNVPESGDIIFASPSKIDLRIDPINVPAENIQFYLTDTKNQDLTPVVLTASASQDSDDDPMNNGEINSRAAITGNGLWTLSMANQVVSKNNKPAEVWNTINTVATADRVYAVNANHAFRSEYKLNVFPIDAETLSQISIKGEEAAYVTSIGNLNGNTDGTATYKTGKEYKVNGVESSALYDMYLTADKSDTEVYGLTFNQDNHTFTIGKNPDVSSIPAEFDLIIYTIANNGIVKKTIVTIALNSEISSPAEYGLHEHDVNKKDNKNYFGIDLSTMKTALGDNLNQWMQNVDLSLTDIEWSDKENGTYSNLPTGFSAEVVSAVLDKDNPNHFAPADRNTANFIQVDIKNTSVNGLELDKTYYIKATFKRSASEVLNSIIVPVEFHAPALSELFSIKDAYFDKTDNVINAYFYDTNSKKTAVTLARYFSESVADAVVSFTDDKIGETNMTGEQLFTMTWSNNNGSTTAVSGSDNTVYFGKDNSVVGSTEKNYTTIDFDANASGKDENGQAKNGYGETVTVKVNKSYYNNDAAATAGWNYTKNGDNEYTFNIRLMSPIYEGSVNPVSGNTINISANDWVKGARITDAMIKGADYNKNTYNVVPDKYVDGSGVAWANPQIESVTPMRDEQNLIKSVTNAPATQDKDKNTVNGAFVVIGESITNTTEVKMPVQVKDVWGYILKEEVSVTIQMNK